MGNNEHEVMADKQRAERIKKVILEHSTYEELAEKTGISVSTLVRIASGKTEPKFSDIIQIAKITGADLNTLAYGYALDVKEEATERKLNPLLFACLAHTPLRQPLCWLLLPNWDCFAMGWLLPDVGQLWGLQPPPVFFRFLSESHPKWENSQGSVPGIIFRPVCMIFSYSNGHPDRSFWKRPHT